MGIVRERERSVDLIKFVASILIVVLHSINPSSEKTQEIVYLLGSFGIPMFFIVNGYLRANKAFTIDFAVKTLLRYAKFMGIWTLIIGIAKLIVVRKVEFISLFIGAIIGKDLLFHLWFLAGLLVLYFLFAIINTRLKEKRINELVTGRHCIQFIMILTTIVFLLNILIVKTCGKEIRDIIFPCLRIITNGGYFVIGMYIGRGKVKLQSKWYWLVCVMLCFGFTVLASQLTGIIWASSYYDFLQLP